MAYQNSIIGVPEMLDTLVSRGRTDHEAARELASALEARTIVLAYRNGHVLDAADLAPVIDLVRDFPSRRTSLRNDLTAQRLQDGGAGSMRLQFELACDLAEMPPPRRLTAEEACKALIIRLKEGPRLPRSDVYARARAEIPDLIEKEFDRAWRDVAGEWAAAGRPKKGAK